MNSQRRKELMEGLDQLANTNLDPEKPIMSAQYIPIIRILLKELFNDQEKRIEDLEAIHTPPEVREYESKNLVSSVWRTGYDPSS